VTQVDTNIVSFLVFHEKRKQNDIYINLSSNEKHLLALDKSISYNSCDLK